jgi:hypothetical protein
LQELEDATFITQALGVCNTIAMTRTEANLLQQQIT